MSAPGCFDQVCDLSGHRPGSARERQPIPRHSYWTPTAARRSLLPPLPHPRPVRPPFHPHPPFAGIAVDPAGEEGADGAGGALAASFGPVAGEGEFYVAVAPGAGDGEGLAEGAGP